MYNKVVLSRALTLSNLQNVGVSANSFIQWLSGFLTNIITGRVTITF